MKSTAESFQAEVTQKIPLVSAMGISIQEFSPTAVKLHVLHAPNKNHINTVFGGSLYSACALACYALFRAMSEESGFTEDFLVIQDGEIKYIKPVGGDFEVLAAPQAHLDMEQFLESVKRQKKGRLPLEAEVLWNGQVCAKFQGQYVMRLP